MSRRRTGRPAPANRQEILEPITPEPSTATFLMLRFMIVGFGSSKFGEFWKMGKRSLGTSHPEAQRGTPLLIFRGGQNHALVGPQPKGNIVKGLCC